MTINDLIPIVSSLGFPIVVCGALFHYINTTHKSLVDSMKKTQETLEKTQETLKQNADVISLLKSLLFEEKE